MDAVIPTPWAYLFVLQELDLQHSALRQHRELALSLGGAGGGHLAEQAAEARQSLHATEARIQDLEREREGVAQLLPSDVRRSYENLRKQQVAPPWVVTLTDETCRGCNGVLETEVLGAARGERTPVQCPSCLRLLLWV